MEPKIIVHGGAWAIPTELTSRSIEGVKRAALEGYRRLVNGESAVDAVVAAVSVLEDDTVFDAGHGAVLNKKGEVEMDAIVVDGTTLRSGGVGCVQDIANPVQLAKAVMEKTDHCLLVGQGANEFADSIGISRVNPGELVTPEAKQEWEKFVKYIDTVNTLFYARTDDGSATTPTHAGCDTVGAVAIDKQGHLASATSTGGITAKIPGRVGDSPIIGAGAYADNESCAASSTGHGESIMKVCLLRRVAEGVERGRSAQNAADSALEIMNKKLDRAAGIIVITNAGEVAHSFTTERMAWADVQGEVLTYGIDPGQRLQENINQGT